MIINMPDINDHEKLAANREAMIVRLRARLSVFENRYEMSSSRVALADARWRGRLKEIARAREIVCDFLVGDNEYASTAESLDACFLPFAMAARRDR
jgi:hypothetical protein